MKKLSLFFVLVAALLLCASCLDTEGGVLTAKKTMTMPAAIASIPVGSTLAVNVNPNFEVLWEMEPEDIVNSPFTNDFIEEKFEEYFSINGGATIGTIYYSPFRRGGVTPEFLKDQVEGLFEYYLTLDKATYFQPNPDDQKALFSTAPADFDYETYPYAPVLVAGGQVIPPTFVLADDPAAADYTLDVYYKLDATVYQVLDFDQGDGYIKDYWDDDKRYLKQAGDVYMFYDVLCNYKLINNATGDVVCEAMTDQVDANIKKNSRYSNFGTEFLTNTDDPATFLNNYDFNDKAVDFVIQSVQSVLPRLRTLWYCNADDMTIVYPEATAE